MLGRKRVITMFCISMGFCIPVAVIVGGVRIRLDQYNTVSGYHIALSFFYFATADG